MKKANISVARSLCAVVLIIALAFLFVPTFPVYAEETRQEDYKYAVTIEFGSMTFCYDYGKWDVGEMRYKADVASQSPANGTEIGYPGWYGFDGVANRISIKYSNENEADGADQNRRLSVTLDYRALTAAEGKEIDGVSMNFYSDASLTMPAARIFTVPHTSMDDTDEKTVIYASLSGKPTENGGKYMSDSFVPVGMLTIRIGEISD